MTTTDTDHKFYADIALRSVAAYRDALRDARKALSSPHSTSLDRERALEVIEANAGLVDQEQALQTCGGSFSWAAAVVWGTLNTTPTLNFEGWGSLNFAGTHWGLGAGAGVSYTLGHSAVHPSRVIGDVSYEMAFLSGSVTITFRRGLQFLLSVAGPAISVGTGAFSGSGTFTRS